MAGSRAGCSAANVVDGMSRERAARQAGMDRQTLRDWVIRFNADGVEGLRDRPRSGRPPRLDEGQLATFKALVLRGPEPERDGVSTWRAKDLCRLVEARFGVVHSENGMLRLLHDLDRPQKARPMRPEVDRQAQARSKKTYGPPRLQVACSSWLSSLRQRIRPLGAAAAKMEIRAFRSC
jgi:putative transposase